MKRERERIVICIANGGRAQTTGGKKGTGGADNDCRLS